MTILSSSGDSGGQASGSDPVAELEVKKSFGTFVHHTVGCIGGSASMIERGADGRREWTDKCIESRGLRQKRLRSLLFD